MALITPTYASPGPKQPLGPFQVERREPGPHDLQIDIEYCGICHSDVHQVQSDWGNAIFPMVPGHEIAGTVVKVGGQVSRYREGDRVGVGCFTDSCRDCPACREGLEQYCRLGMVLTYNGYEKDGKTPTYGGYSTRIVVDENYVLRIPENLPLDRAAPLLCAGITTYSPLRYWKAGPGKHVAVLGLGGLGHMAVQLAHAMGSEVSVLSHSIKKKEDGVRLGADNFYATTETGTLEKLAGQFDLILNTVSVELDWNAYLNLLKRDGVMIQLGVPTKAPEINVFNLIFQRRALAGSLIGGIAETQEMLDFCGQHNIASQIELIPITQVNDAYNRMVKSDVRYRFVIDIGTLKS